MNGGGSIPWRSMAATVAAASLLAACTFDWTRQPAPTVEPQPDPNEDAGPAPAPDAGANGDDAGTGHPEAGPHDAGIRALVPTVTAWVTAGTAVNGEMMNTEVHVSLGSGEPVRLVTDVFDSPAFLAIETQDGTYQETACVELGFDSPVRSASATARRLDDSGMAACPTMTTCYEVDVFAFTPGQPSSNSGYQHLSRDDLWQQGPTSLSSSLPDGTTMVLLCPWRPTELAAFAGVPR